MDPRDSCACLRERAKDVKKSQDGILTSRSFLSVDTVTSRIQEG